MQIVACQLDIAWEDKAANFRRVRAMLADARIEPGALVVLPEMFATGFSMHVDTIAEPADGPTHQFLAELAREHRAFVLGGVVTRADDGRGRNDAVLFDPDGTLLHALRQDASLFVRRRDEALPGGRAHRDFPVARLSRRTAGLLRPALSRGVSPGRGAVPSCWS